MRWFKGEDPMPDDSIDLEEQRATAFRLTEEMARLSAELLRKAEELKRELASVRQQAEGR
jgi:hypothetical protein